MITLVPSFLNVSSSFLQVTRTAMKAWMTLNFCQIQQRTTAAIDPALSRLLLILSFLNLRIGRKCIISWMSSNFGQIGPQTTELAALERLKISQLAYNGENSAFTFSRLFSYLRAIQSILMTFFAGSQVAIVALLGYLFTVCTGLMLSMHRVDCVRATQPYSRGGLQLSRLKSSLW